MIKQYKIIQYLLWPLTLAGSKLHITVCSLQIAVTSDKCVCTIRYNYNRHEMCLLCCKTKAKPLPQSVLSQPGRKIRSDSKSPDFSSQVTLHRYSTFKTISDDQSNVQAWNTISNKSTIWRSIKMKWQAQFLVKAKAKWWVLLVILNLQWTEQP